ncbi:MAG: thioesterase family protein [Pseudoxanthomonas sp.]|nr:thioesterase family protein [Pseudoxanthomonas sp.]
MRLRLRLLWVFLRSFLCARLGVLDESVLPFTVLPNDVDISRLTDDRYLAIADLGRIDLALRVGLRTTLVRQRWTPIATLAAVRYRHPLRLFQRYRLRTQVLWWDESAFYLRQVFERGGRVQATAYLRATFLGAHETVDPATVLAHVREPVDRPRMPEVIPQLQSLAEAIHREQLDGDRVATPLEGSHAAGRQ